MDIPKGKRRVMRNDDFTHSETNSQRIEHDGDEHAGPLMRG